MRKLHGCLLVVGLVGPLSGCADDWLTTEPQTILTDEQVWTDPRLIEAVLADFYSRLPKHTDFGGPYNCGSASAYCAGTGAQSGWR